MIQFPQFTQYYIVSIIFPGIFNGLLVLFSLNTTFLKCQKIPCEPYEWLLFTFFSIVLTYAIGMLPFVEKCIFGCVKPCNNDLKYCQLASWRECALKIAKNNNSESKLKIGFLEKLMGEYYCFNNIIVGTILSALIMLAYIFTCPKQGIQNLIFPIVILIFAILCMGKAMNTWLTEFKKICD